MIVRITINGIKIKPIDHQKRHKRIRKDF
jgi:hypothetical protein